MKFSYCFKSMFLMGLSVVFFASCSNDEFASNDTNEPQSSLRVLSSNPLMGKWLNVSEDERGNTTYDHFEFTENRFLEQIVGGYENGTFNKDKISYQFNSGYTYVDGASYFLMESSFGGPATKVYYAINGDKLVMNPNTDYSVTFTRVN